MDLSKLFGGVYSGRRVLVTGHTGFKGSWLCQWLESMGAVVAGFSLDNPSDPCHHDELKVDFQTFHGDICKLPEVIEAVEAFQPEIIFHLAAQPLVRASYDIPVETIQTNVMGSVHVMEAARLTDSVKAVLNVTTDKCYENREWVWGYREIDPMGGHDPYSASKGASEIVTASYRNSFLNETSGKFLASARAGNVIGGGDWGKDRLIPDIVRSIVKREELEIRSPNATRPWQHVMEPLSGYLMIGQKLLEGNRDFAEAWNFGPHDTAQLTVVDVLEEVKKVWPEVTYRCNPDHSRHEANLLKLDYSKAAMKLGWSPVWDAAKTIQMTMSWYRSYHESAQLLTKEQLATYVQDAEQAGRPWATLETAAAV